MYVALVQEELVPHVYGYTRGDSAQLERLEQLPWCEAARRVQMERAVSLLEAMSPALIEAIASGAVDVGEVALDMAQEAREGRLKRY